MSSPPNRYRLPRTWSSHIPNLFIEIYSDEAALKRFAPLSQVCQQGGLYEKRLQALKPICLDIELSELYVLHSHGWHKVRMLISNLHLISDRILLFRLFSLPPFTRRYHHHTTLAWISQLDSERMNPPKPYQDDHVTPGTISVQCG